jgi:PAS domain S-box-containing protein
MGELPYLWRTSAPSGVHTNMHTLSNFSEEFHTLFAHVPAPLMLIQELGGIIIAVNPAALKLFECDGINVLGKTTVDLGIWTRPQERSRLMHVIARTGHIENRTVRMRSLTGRTIAVSLSVKAVTMTGLKCFLATFIDVSWQENLAMTLRTNQNHLAMRQSGTLAGSWRLDSAKGLLFFSERAHTMLDQASTNDQAAGLPVGAVVHPDEVDNFLTLAESPSGESNPMDLTLRLRTGGGNYRWFRVWRSALDDCGSLEDIHSYKTLEIARLREAQKAALATSAANMGTWETFLDGTAVWDPQTYRLYGYDPSTTILPHIIFQSVQTTAGFARTARWLGKSLKHGLSLSIEFEIRWPDGQVRWLASQGGFSPATEFAAPSLLGIAWDITEQRRAQDTLRKHQQELSSLTMQLLEQEKLTANKLALALHDQLGQTLTATQLILGVQMSEHPTESGRKMGALLGRAMYEVRNLLMELRPPMLEENGLGPALQNEIERVRSEGAHYEITLDASQSFKESRWPPDVEYAFFMIAREAISNALAHAKADLIQVLLQAEEGGFTMEIVDDGRGFDSENRGLRPGHLGLIGMRERAKAINARLTFCSLPGNGTRVKLTWAALS